MESIFQNLKNIYIPRPTLLHIKNYLKNENYE